MKKIGFLLSQFGVNQLSYQLIHSANNLLSRRDDVDPSLYWFQDGPRIIQPRFLTANAYEMYTYDGISVATSLHTAARILDWPGPNKHPYIYYYLFDLCWLRQQQKHWDQLKQIYMHPKIRLVSRSEDHAKIIRSVWKEPFCVIPDCRVDLFAEKLE